MDLRGRSLRCSKVSFFLFVFFSESLNCRVSKCVDPCVEMKWSSVLVGLHCWELASLQTLSAKLPITVAFSTVWVLGDPQLGSGHQFSLSKRVFTSCLRSDLTTQLCLVLYILFIFYYILVIYRYIIYLFLYILFYLFCTSNNLTATWEFRLTNVNQFNIQTSSVFQRKEFSTVYLDMIRKGCGLGLSALSLHVLILWVERLSLVY